MLPYTILNTGPVLAYLNKERREETIYTIICDLYRVLRWFSLTTFTILPLDQTLRSRPFRYVVVP